MASERARVEAEVLQAVERRLELDEILGRGSNQWEVPIDEDIKTPEKAADFAEELRERWSLGENPIPDVTELLEEKGLIVLMLDLPNKVSGLTCFVERETGSPVPVIVVNRTHPLERRRFTLAHELGHRLFRVVDKEGAQDDRATEKAANNFAGSFLMQKDHFKSLVGENRRAFGVNEIVMLKRVYRVSGAAFLYRMKQLGMISESELIHSFRTFARIWRKEEPQELELFDGEAQARRGILERPKLFEINCFHALAEGFISKSKASELLDRDIGDIELGVRGLG